MDKLYNIAWWLKRKARSQPNKNGFAKWLGVHKLLLADKTLLVSYFSLSPSLLPPLPHSPNDALCSIANALQVLVPLLDREHRITHPGWVETRRKRHLCNSRSWQSGCEKQTRERQQSLRYQVIACVRPWQVSLLVTCAHNLFTQATPIQGCGLRDMGATTTRRRARGGHETNY